MQMIVVGQNRSNIDAAVLSNSNLEELLNEDKSYVPEGSPLNGYKFEPLSYCLLGDDIFSLKL